MTTMTTTATSEESVDISEVSSSPSSPSYAASDAAAAAILETETAMRAAEADQTRKETEDALSAAAEVYANAEREAEYALNVASDMKRARYAGNDVVKEAVLSDVGRLLSSLDENSPVRVRMEAAAAQKKKRMTMTMTTMTTMTSEDDADDSDEATGR